MPKSVEEKQITQENNLDFMWEDALEEFPPLL